MALKLFFAYFKEFILILQAEPKNIIDTNVKSLEFIRYYYNYTTYLKLKININIKPSKTIRNPLSYNDNMSKQVFFNIDNLIEPNILWRLLCPC